MNVEQFLSELSAASESLEAVRNASKASGGYDLTQEQTAMVIGLVDEISNSVLSILETSGIDNEQLVNVCIAELEGIIESIKEDRSMENLIRFTEKSNHFMARWDADNISKIATQEQGRKFLELTLELIGIHKDLEETL
jgi:ketol-acid reductoisomerase